MTFKETKTSDGLTMIELISSTDDESSSDVEIVVPNTTNNSSTIQQSGNSFAQLYSACLNNDKKTFRSNSARLLKQQSNVFEGIVGSTAVDKMIAGRG